MEILTQTRKEEVVGGLLDALYTDFLYMIGRGAFQRSVVAFGRPRAADSEQPSAQPGLQAGI